MSTERLDLGPLLKESLRTAFQPRRWWATLRHPIDALRSTVGDGAVFPLLILFGLNAVDELDRTGFGILIPNIRDSLGMSNRGILSLIGVTLLGALLLQLPIAIWADRGPRVLIAVIGAAVWGVFSVLTGLSTTVWMLVIARSGAGIGRAVVDPTHNSLLADLYPVDRRASVYSFHRAANAVGQFLGPLLAGGIAYVTGSWRIPFFVMAVPTAILVLVGLRLREPVRGAQERRAIGGTEEQAATEEPTPSFGESYRLVSQIESLRRLWYSMPFLAVAFIGFVTMGALLYEEVFRLNELQRGYLAAGVEPFQLFGLAVGAAVGTRLYLRNPALIFRFLRIVALTSGVLALAFAWAPTLWMTAIANILLSACLAILLPGLLASLSMAVPAKSRAVGFAMAAYWAIPGLVILPLVGWLSDHYGIRVGLTLLAPVLVIGGLIVASVGTTIRRDTDDVWRSSLSQAEALRSFEAGTSKQLVVRDLHVSYGPLRVLSGVSLEVEQGAVVALLGTNGAGKSTLLNAICGVTEASYGAVIFDGRDITHAPPHEISALGVSVMPGGAGTFGSLTVRDNLRVAGFNRRGDRTTLESDEQRMLDLFPVLRNRGDEPAVNLSGGQQQQLALAMALLTRPKLLLIDELSLGLAPIVVEQLAETVREVAESGTTIILVEQSVNIALTLADTAYFMEKGEIRFSGPTADLLSRPDLLRSVYLADGSPTQTGGAELSSTSTPSPTDASVILETRDVSVAFGGVTAVSGVSIEVHAGEVVGLIGQNGAGKTTLLDVLSGFNSPSSGVVRFDGRDITHVGVAGRARRGIGRSFQDAMLYPGLTVEETVLLSLESQVAVRNVADAVFRTPPFVQSEFDAHLRADELIELMGIGLFRDKYVRELSTGSRRIVDLACVVAQHPRVIMLDEPSSGIAQRETEALGPLLLRIRRELGCSMVIVEHDMPLVSTVSDRLIAMEAGSVLASGTPDEVLTNPDVVESYLGATAAIIERSTAGRNPS